jgi:hypothetical protein
MSGRALWSRLALAALPLLLGACAGSKVLEQRQVMAYRCETTALEITLSGSSSGSSSGSALNVTRVRKVREGKDLLVNVHVGAVTFSKSGTFVEKIPIKPGLSRVLFGRERVVVWSREQGCAAVN